MATRHDIHLAEFLKCLVLFIKTRYDIPKLGGVFQIQTICWVVDCQIKPQGIILDIFRKNNEEKKRE